MSVPPHFAVVVVVVVVVVVHAPLLCAMNMFGTALERLGACWYYDTYAAASVHVFFFCTTTCSLKRFCFFFCFTQSLSAHELIFQLLGFILKSSAAFDEIGDPPHARMIPTCVMVYAIPMGPVHTPKLADYDFLRCAFWLPLLFFALEVTTFPRAQCGVAGRANAIPPFVLPTAIAWRARASTRTSHCHHEQ